jgi:hypothetical protein
MNIIFDTDKFITHWYHVHQNTDTEKKNKTKYTFREMFVYDTTCVGLTFILRDPCDVVGKSQDSYLIKNK